MRFHGSLYAAPLMTLCVQGREKPQDLRAQVETAFAAVPSGPIAPPEMKWWGLEAPYLQMLPQDPSPRAREVIELQVVPVNPGTSQLTATW